jgi:50S ribosomal subunit-associated GTPase HflX
MSTGKPREIAEARAQHQAAAVVFYNELTDHQRTVLAEVIGCAVFTHKDL